MSKLSAERLEQIRNVDSGMSLGIAKWDLLDHIDALESELAQEKRRSAKLVEVLEEVTDYTHSDAYKIGQAALAEYRKQDENFER